MKSTELRIGNYVIDQEDEVKMIYITEDNTSWLEPIPLTEERFLKFELDDFLIYKQDGVYWYDLTSDCVELKYVHQLQNLYFALKNKELSYEK